MDSGIFAFEKVADWFDSALAHYLLISVRQSRLVATGFDSAAGRARLAEPKPMGCYVRRPLILEWHDYRRLSACGGSPYWKVVAQGFRLGKPRPTNVGSRQSPGEETLEIVLMLTRMGGLEGDLASVA